MPRTKLRLNSQLVVNYSCQSRSNKMQQRWKSMAHKSAISKRQHHVLETSRHRRHLSSIIKISPNQPSLSLKHKTRPPPTQLRAMVLLVQQHNIKERFPKAICWEDIKIPLYLEIWFKKINKNMIKNYRMKSRRQARQTRLRAGSNRWGSSMAATKHSRNTTPAECRCSIQIQSTTCRTNSSWPYQQSSHSTWGSCRAPSKRTLACTVPIPRLQWFPVK